MLRVALCPVAYCGNCDLLVGLDGLHVLKVVATGDGLLVRVESPPGPMGCRACGVVAISHGRREVELIDAPCFGRPVRVMWVPAPDPPARWECSPSRTRRSHDRAPS